MASKPECKWTKQVCRQLEALGAQVFAAVGGMYQKNGWPDRCVWHKDFCGWLEFKYGDGKLSSLQAYTCQRLWDIAPGSVWVVRGGIVGLCQIETIDGLIANCFDGSGKDLLAGLKVCKLNTVLEDKK